MIRVALVIIALAAVTGIGYLIFATSRQARIVEMEKAREKLVQSEEETKNRLEKQIRDSKALGRKLEILESEAARRDEKLANKEDEIAALKAENLRQKKLLDAMAPPEPDKPEEKSAKLIEQCRDLIAQLEEFPTDRSIMKELSEKVWLIKDPDALKAMVENLRRILDGALADSPDDLDLLFNKGQSYSAEMTWFQLMMSENPNMYGPKAADAALKAIDAYSKILTKNPKDNEALLNRAYWCYHMPGQVKKAEEDFIELVKRAKNERFDQDTGETVFLGMAMTYEKSKNKEASRKAIEEGLLLYPDSQKLREYQEKLEE